MQHLLADDLDHVLEKASDVWHLLRGANIFLTGGTGFVGTWLVESFAWANRQLDLGAKLTVLTRNPKASCWGATLLHGDIRSFEFPRREFKFVIHAATGAGLAFPGDIEGTERVLEFARASHTKRLLFTSSGAVYRPQPPEVTHVPESYAGAPFTNDLGSPYGQAKRASEFLCAQYARQYWFTAVIARLFAFAGPHLPLDRNFALGNFVRDALTGGPIRVEGDGSPYRSYLYAADLAIWLWKLLLLGDSAQPYNVGSDEALTIAELAQLVRENTNPSCEIVIAKPPTVAKPARYVPSIERARTQLGLRPFIPLAEGVRRMYAWHFAKAHSSMK